MNHIILAYATGLYTGLIKKAPGTWGSLFAFLPWLFFKDANPGVYIGITAICFVTGFLAAGAAEKILDTPDAGSIVIDEIVGMFVTLFLVPPHFILYVLGFMFFRIFDILKPFPVSWLDKHIHGGMGIMLDDVMAGIYAWCSLTITYRLLLHLNAF